MALTDSDKLRSPDDKKFKGHTEDKTIKVATAFTKYNPSYYIINYLRDKASKISEKILIPKPFKSKNKK